MDDPQASPQGARGKSSCRAKGPWHALQVARNIEIKALVDRLDPWLVKAKALADSGPTELSQDDTFFSCANGRLKLRAFSSSAGELIFYRRPNSAGPKPSTYWIVPTSSPDSLREVLTLSYGQVGRVRKTRTVFLIGRTRVHLDRVEGLGNFIELEVVLSEGEPTEAGVKLAEELLARFGIGTEQLIEGAYIDLLQDRCGGSRG